MALFFFGYIPTKPFDLHIKKTSGVAFIKQQVQLEELEVLGDAYPTLTSLHHNQSIGQAVVSAGDIILVRGTSSATDWARQTLTSKEFPDGYILVPFSEVLGVKKK